MSQYTPICWDYFIFMRKGQHKEKKNNCVYCNAPSVGRICTKCRKGKHTCYVCKDVCDSRSNVCKDCRDHKKKRSQKSRFDINLRFD